MSKRRGASYQKRVTDINRIYDQHAKSGISNRERTFYNLLNASCDPKNEVPQEAQTFLKFDFDDEPGHTENYPQYPKRR